jgi:hypothetical protein
MLVLIPGASDAAAYKHFRAAIYIPVGSTKRLADPATFEREFARVSSQLKFDKVYIEAYRDRQIATDAELEGVKRAFRRRALRPRAGSRSRRAAPAASSVPSIMRIRATAPNASAPCG